MKEKIALKLLAVDAAYSKRLESAHDIGINLYEFFGDDCNLIPVLMDAMGIPPETDTPYDDWTNPNVWAYCRDSLWDDLSKCGRTEEGHKQFLEILREEGVRATAEWVVFIAGKEET